MQLGSQVAVAVAVTSSCSYNSIPSLGTSICHGVALKSQLKKKERKKKKKKKDAIELNGFSKALSTFMSSRKKVNGKLSEDYWR